MSKWKKMIAAVLAVMVTAESVAASEIPNVDDGIEFNGVDGSTEATEEVEETETTEVGIGYDADYDEIQAIVDSMITAGEGTDATEMTLSEGTGKTEAGVIEAVPRGEVTVPFPELEKFLVPVKNPGNEAASEGTSDENVLSDTAPIKLGRIDDYPWVAIGENERIIVVKDNDGNSTAYICKFTDDGQVVLEQIASVEEMMAENPDAVYAIAKCDDGSILEEVTKADSFAIVDDIYVLQYDKNSVAKKDVKNLNKLDDVDFAELDVELDVATVVSNGTEVTGLTETVESTEAIEVMDMDKKVKVAVLDTGLRLTNDILLNRFEDTKLNYSSSGDADSILDDNGHGTTMAEIIASYTKGTKVTILPVKVANSDGKSSMLAAYLGIRSAIELGADVINMSMNAKASEKSETFEYAVKCANEAGIKVVVSAGNIASDVENITPSNLEEAIVVSAVNADKGLANYSNYGATIDYCAYGQYGDSVGTSNAAARVTAFIAAALNKGEDANEALQKAAIPLDDTGRSEKFGYGFIDLGDLDPDSVEETKTVLDVDWKSVTDTELEELVENTNEILLGKFLSELSEEETVMIKNRCPILMDEYQSCLFNYEEEDAVEYNVIGTMYDNAIYAYEHAMSEDEFSVSYFKKNTGWWYLILYGNFDSSTGPSDIVNNASVLKVSVSIYNLTNNVYEDANYTWHETMIYNATNSSEKGAVAEDDDKRYTSEELVKEQDDFEYFAKVTARIPTSEKKGNKHGIRLIGTSVENGTAPSFNYSSVYDDKVVGGDHGIVNPDNFAMGTESSEKVSTFLHPTENQGDTEHNFYDFRGTYARALFGFVFDPVDDFVFNGRRSSYKTTNYAFHMVSESGVTPADNDDNNIYQMMFGDNAEKLAWQYYKEKGINQFWIDVNLSENAGLGYISNTNFQEGTSGNAGIHASMAVLLERDYQIRYNTDGGECTKEGYSVNENGMIKEGDGIYVQSLKLEENTKSELSFGIDKEGYFVEGSATDGNTNSTTELKAYGWKYKDEIEPKSVSKFGLKKEGYTLADMPWYFTNADGKKVFIGDYSIEKNDYLHYVKSGDTITVEVIDEEDFTEGKENCGNDEEYRRGSHLIAMLYQSANKNGVIKLFVNWEKVTKVCFDANGGEIAEGYKYINSAGERVYYKVDSDNLVTKSKKKNGAYSVVYQKFYSSDTEIDLCNVKRFGLSKTINGIIYTVDPREAWFYDANNNSACDDGEQTFSQKILSGEAAREQIEALTNLAKKSGIVRLKANWQANPKIYYNAFGGAAKTNSTLRGKINGSLDKDGLLLQSNGAALSSKYPVSELENGRTFLSLEGYHLGLTEGDAGYNTLVTNMDNAKTNQWTDSRNNLYSVILDNTQKANLASCFTALDTGDPESDNEVVLYANWKPNHYTVSYQKSEDVGCAVSGTTDDSKHTYDVSTELSENGYQAAGPNVNLVSNMYQSGKEGYMHVTGVADDEVGSARDFMHWDTAKLNRGEHQSGNKEYSDYQSVINLTAVDGDIVWMYAHWDVAEAKMSNKSEAGFVFWGWKNQEDDAQELQFEDPNNDGNASSRNQQNTSSTEYTEFVSVNEQGLMKGDIYTTPNGVAEVSLYAQWVRKWFQIHYDYGSNGGYQKDSNGKKDAYDYFLYDYAVEIRTDAEKDGDTGVYSTTNTDGWQFVGWSLDKDAGEAGHENAVISTDAATIFADTDGYMPAEDVTLYAIYKKVVTAKYVDYEYDGSDNYATVEDDGTKQEWTEQTTVWNENTQGDVSTDTRHTWNNTKWCFDGWTLAIEDENAWLKKPRDSIYAWFKEQYKKPELSTLAGNDKPTQKDAVMIWEDTTFYGQYHLYVASTFVHEDEDEIVGERRYRNSYRIDTISDACSKTPKLNDKKDKYSINGGSWKHVGWTKGYDCQSKKEFNEAITFYFTGGEVYYGLYQKSITLDYDLGTYQLTSGSVVPKKQSKTAYYTTAAWDRDEKNEHQYVENNPRVAAVMDTGEFTFTSENLADSVNTNSDYYLSPSSGMTIGLLNEGTLLSAWVITVTDGKITFAAASGYTGPARSYSINTVADSAGKPYFKISDMKSMRMADGQMFDSIKVMGPQYTTVYKSGKTLGYKFPEFTVCEAIDVYTDTANKGTDLLFKDWNINKEETIADMHGWEKCAEHPAITLLNPTDDFVWRDRYQASTTYEFRCNTKLYPQFNSVDAPDTIEISKSLLVGDKAEVAGEFKTTAISDQTRVYTSRDTSVAIVTQGGRITAIGEGITVIDVTTSSGMVIGRCSVYVSACAVTVPVKMALGSKAWIGLKVGTNGKIDKKTTATAKLSMAALSGLKGETTDNVYKLQAFTAANENSKYTAISEGAAILTVSATNNGAVSAVTKEDRILFKIDPVTSYENLESDFYSANVVFKLDFKLEEKERTDDEGRITGCSFKQLPQQQAYTMLDSGLYLRSSGTYVIGLYNGETLVGRVSVTTESDGHSIVLLSDDGTETKISTKLPLYVDLNGSGYVSAESFSRIKLVGGGTFDRIKKIAYGTHLVYEREK